MRARPERQWRPTPHGEWYCPGVGILYCDGSRWYAYPLDGSRRLGPYDSLPEAEVAAEQRLLPEARSGSG